MWSDMFYAKVRRRELIIFGICFGFSFVLNLAFIAKYAAPWQEIFTSLGEVLIHSALIYGLILLLRLAWYILHRVWGE